MVTVKEVKELLKNYTVKEFLDQIDIGTEFQDYRSQVIVSHL